MPKLPKRPALEELSQEVRVYIETLEAEIDRLTITQAAPVQGTAFEPADAVEPPSTINVLSVTANGFAKRTPRHHYTRQRRGGMGVFDLDPPENDPPVILTTADEHDSLLLITNRARAFRLAVKQVAETPVHSRGQLINAKLNLTIGEQLAIVLPIRAQGYLVLLSENGMVRSLRHHVFGEYMKPGIQLFDFRAFGQATSACWSPGDGELFLGTRQGRAIRFSEKLIPPQGCPGIRLAETDSAIAITAVYPESGVLLITADGKGTIRQMEGFAPNKKPGAGGKNAIITTNLIAAATVDRAKDVFIISRLGKIIRFPVSEIPAKEGVVQGVNCMSFRADEAVAIAVDPDERQTHL